MADSMTPDEAWSWIEEVRALAADEARMASAYSHRPNDVRRHRKEEARLTARADFLQEARFGMGARKPTTAPEAGAVGTTEGREPNNPTTREGADR